jgi:hypothetical protein
LLTPTATASPTRFVFCTSATAHAGRAVKPTNTRPAVPEPKACSQSSQMMAAAR